MWVDLDTITLNDVLLVLDNDLQMHGHTHSKLYGAFFLKAGLCKVDRHLTSLHYPHYYFTIISGLCKRKPRKRGNSKDYF